MSTSSKARAACSGDARVGIRLRLLLVASGVAVALADAALAQPLVVNWQGPNDGLWSTAANWNPAVVGGPANVAPFPVYDVRITAGGSPVQHDKGTVASPNEITSFTLMGRHLTIPTGRGLRVLEQASLCGVLSADEGYFESLMASLPCDNQRFVATSGGKIVIEGPTVLSWIGLGPAAALTSTGTSATGEPSMISLQTITTISDSGWSWSGGAHAHTIAAANGGSIDLRNVAALIGPASDERLDLRATDGGVLNLASVRSATATGNGWVDIVADDSGISLPSLETLNATRLFAINGGSIVAAGAMPVAWTPGGLPPTAFLTADGAGSTLDLRAFTTINDGGWSWSGGAHAHTIAAANGGSIDLRNVTALIGPASDERLDLRATDGGVLNLASVRSATATGNGWVDIVADDSGISLPSLETLNATRLFAINGGSIVAAGAMPVAWTPGGLPPTAFLTADGAGSTLDLRAWTSIDGSAWSWGGGSHALAIEATDGGAIDLGQLMLLRGPTSDEYLRLTARGESSWIDLSSLTAVLHGGASGTVRLALASAGRMNLGALDAQTGMSIELEGSGTVLDVSGTMRATAGTGVVLDLESAGARLEVGGSLLLGTFPAPPPPVPPTITLTAAKGAMVTIGGDFVYTQSNTGQVKVDQAVVTFNGTGTQRCEVGGTDLGINGPCLLPDGNFGIGQLVVGQAGGPATTLRLSDLIDNGHRAGRPEAMYLWGSFERATPAPTPCGPTMPQIDGLRVLGGSTLFLDSVNAYAFQGGQWEHLNCRLSGDVRRVAYDQGFLEANACYANCDGSTAPPILNVADFICFQNRFAEQSCYANCDGSTAPPILNVADFICYLNKFAEGCSAP